MAIEDDIRLALRDYKTVTATYPLGDPSSPVWNPPKKTLRDALVPLGAEADALSASVVDAETSRAQAELAAIAAGATLYDSTADGLAGTVSGDVFLVSTEPGVQVYRNDTTATFLGWLGRVEFDTFGSFIASNTTFIAGTLVTVRDIQATYRAIAGTGTGNLGQANAGGQEFEVVAVVGGFDFAFFGCSATADSTAAYQAALEAANGQPIRHTSTIKVDGAVSYSGPVNIWSPGDAGILDLSGGGSISFVGGLTAIPDLSSAIQQYSNGASFVAAHGLSVGDVFCVYNPTDFSFNPQREEYRDGDWIEVAEVVTTTAITMFGSSPDLYAASDVDCYKMEGEGVSILGLTVIPNPVGVHFFIHNHKRVDCRMGYERGADDTGVQILRCYNIKFECLPMDINQGDAYPVIIGNSKNFTVYLDRARSTRHIIGFGGSGGPGSVPNRNGKVIGGRLTNNLDLGIGSADFHGNNDNLQYIGCDMFAANMGGRNNALIDCTLWGRYPFDADDNVVFSAAAGGGLVRIHDCTLKVRGTGNPFAFIHFELTNLASDICFDIRNLAIDHADSGVTAQQAIEFNLGTTTHAYNIDIVIDGLHYRGAILTRLVEISGTPDLSSQMSLSIDGLKCPPCQLVRCGNTANYAMPMKLPRQTVSEDLSVTTAANYFSTNAINFNWTYPRIPNGVISMHPTDGATFTQTPFPTANIRKITANDCLLAISSFDGANFTFAKDFRVVGQFWIDDF